MALSDAARPSGIRVVLADDTADMRMLLRATLQLDGRFEVVGEAGNGSAVIELASETQPDAVVLDVSMPTIDGLQAILRLRTRVPAAQIVVLSGHPSAEMAAEARALGAAAYLEKSAAVAELVDVLAEVCGSDPAGPPPRATDGLDEILSFLSHELQNPVTVIQGLAATLRASMEVMDEQVVRTAVEAIERNARNLGELVRSLGEARALEGGRLTVTEVPIDLAAFVREAVRDLAVLVAGHPLDVDVGDEAVVPLDPVLIRQVVTNLLSNAAKFSPPGSPIQVAVTASPTAVDVTVDDRGPGIPPDRESELFQMFSRLDSATKGMGLGLFISRGIARAHGGELTHERRPEGGARFRLTLPRQGAGPPPAN
ncbi:MAG: ATP-binding response regulator [Actinomycetota bacterium]